MTASNRSAARDARGAQERPAERAFERTPPKSARRRSRELAMQGLYQWLVAKEDAGVIEAHLTATAPNVDRIDREHFVALLHGVIREAASLRDHFSALLDRPVIELSPVEHAALLVGSFELLHHPEIPYRVVINEAVELTKTFGGTDGFRYVNGVLDKVAARLRPAEVTAR